MSVMGIGWSEDHEQKQPTAIFLCSNLQFMERKINDAYKVSEQTAKFVRCYTLANELYAEVANTLEEIYGEMQVDTAIQQFSDKFGDMQKELEIMLTDCMIDNLNTAGNDNVL